jgi:hypothetical protein
MYSLYLYDKGEYELASNLHVVLHVLVSMGASLMYIELSNIDGVEDTGVLYR